MIPMTLFDLPLALPAPDTLPYGLGRDGVDLGGGAGGSELV